MSQNNNQLTNEQLAYARDAAGAAYLSAYVQLMARTLGIPEGMVEEPESLRALAIKLIEPVNIATEIAWRTLMEDHDGADEALKRLTEVLGEMT